MGFDRVEWERDRNRRRNRRARRVKPITVKLDRNLTALRHGRELYPEPILWRPTTRGECKHGIRPCPFSACKWHLYIDEGRGEGSLKFNFPDAEPWEIPATCALDIADRGGATLETVARLLNITREAARLIEKKALARLRANPDTPRQVMDWIDDEDD